VTSPFVQERAQLLALLRTNSYAERDVVLSSGQKSTFYIDCKQTVLTGLGHVLVGACFLQLLHDAEQASGGTPHPAIGGLTMGADPLASALSLTSTQRGRNLDAIYVRKEPKGHGTGAYLEGTFAIAAGARVAIVEDVVTTGNASQTAAKRLREHGYVVDTVLTIVDREAGGKEALAAMGLTLHALFVPGDFQNPLPVP
jgi:orotate phosphoribosyltransferase